MLNIHTLSVTFLIAILTITSEIEGLERLVDVALLGQVYRKSDRAWILYRKDYDDLQSDKSQKLGSTLCSGLVNRFGNDGSCALVNITASPKWKRATVEVQLKMDISGTEIDEVGCVTYQDLKKLYDQVNKLQSESSVKFELIDLQVQLPLRNKHWEVTWKAEAYWGDNSLKFKTAFEEQGSEEFKKLENYIKDYVHGAIVEKNEKNETKIMPTVQLNKVYQEENKLFYLYEATDPEAKGEMLTMVKFTLGITDPKREFCASLERMKQYGWEAIETGLKDEFGLNWITLINNPIRKD